MPTTDRTTIKASVETLTTMLRNNLIADPPTASQPFRRITFGAWGMENFPRPHMSLQLSGSKPVGIVDNDKVFEVGMSIRIFTDVTDTDGFASVLDHMGAVDDYLDSLIDTGIIEGTDGFDDRAWSIEYPKETTGARVVIATTKPAAIPERNNMRGSVIRILTSILLVSWE